MKVTRTKHRWAMDHAVFDARCTGDREVIGQIWLNGFEFALNKASKMVAGVGNEPLAFLIENIGNNVPVPTGSEGEKK